MVGCSNIIGFGRYDAAVEVGGEVGYKQTVHTDRTLPAHVGGYSPFTFPPKSPKSVTLNGIMAIILRNYTELGTFGAH